MSITQTEIRGLAQKELETLRQKRAALEKAGLKVDHLEEVLVTQLADATAEDARQEFLKVEGKSSTTRVNVAYEALYETSSGLLDAIMGVLGKNSDEARILARMRSGIRRPGDTAAATTPGEPAPGSPA